MSKLFIRRAVILVAITILIATGLSLWSLYDRRYQASFADSLQGIHRPSKVEDAIIGMKVCIQQCSNELEAQLARQMLLIYKDIAAGRSTFAQQVSALSKIMSQTLDHYDQTGSLDERLKAYRSSLGFVSSLKATGRSSPQFQRQVFNGIDHLTENHPNSADVWLLMASARSLRGEKDESVLQAYVRCLKADPQHERCAQNYRRFVLVYTQPKCLQKDISPDLRFYVGKTKKQLGSDRSLQYQQTPYYIKESPSISAADIESITPAPGPRGQGRLSIVFDSRGRELLAQMTRQNQGDHLLTVFADEVLSAPVIMDEIAHGQAVLSDGTDAQSDGHKLFERVCLRVTAKELPMELRL